MKKISLTTPDERKTRTANKNNKATDKSILFRFNLFISNPIVLTILYFLILIIVFLFINYVINSLFSFFGNLKYIFKGMFDMATTFAISNAIHFKSNFKIIYIITFIALAIADAVLIIKIHISYKDFNVAQKGGERFTTVEEKREQYKAVPIHGGEWHSERGGVIISRDGDNFLVDEEPGHTLEVGTTRSGKGEIFVRPMIELLSRCDCKPSMIINDPKTLELTRNNYQGLKQRGYDVIVLNLVNAALGDQYNPFSRMVDLYKNGDIEKAYQEGRAFAYSIFCSEQNSKNNTDGDIWNDTSTALLSALAIGNIEDCLKLDEQERIEAEYDFKCKQIAFSDLTAEEQQKLINDFNFGKFDIKYAKAVPPQCEFAFEPKHEKEINMYSIFNNFRLLAENVDENGVTALDKYFTSRPLMNRARMFYSSVKISGYRTKTSIYALMHNAEEAALLPQMQKEIEADSLSLMLRQHLEITEIEDVRQDHLKSAYKKYVKMIENDANKNGYPDLSKILDNVNKAYTSIIEDFDKSITNYLELHHDSVQHITLDDYLRQRELYSPVSDFMVDKMRIPHGLTQNQQNKLDKQAQQANEQYHIKRDAAIKEYNEKVASGEIVPPTNVERYIEAAKGHPDNSSTQAAIRALKKRGYIQDNTGKWIKKSETIQQKDFSETIDDFLNGNINPTDQIFVCQATEVMKACGADNLDVMIYQNTIKKILSDDLNKFEHPHNLTPDTLKKLPEQLQKPIMVFKGSHEGSIVLITDLYNENNEQIIISCQLNSTNKRHEINRITSMYGKENITNYLNTQIKKDNLIGCQKNIANQMLQSVGLYLPSEETFIDYTDIISNINENVNTLAEKNGFYLIEKNNLFAFGTENILDNSAIIPVNQIGSIDEIKAELKRWKAEVDFDNPKMLEIENTFINKLTEIQNLKSEQHSPPNYELREIAQWSDDNNYLNFSVVIDDYLFDGTFRINDDINGKGMKIVGINCYSSGQENQVSEIWDRLEKQLQEKANEMQHLDKFQTIAKYEQSLNISPEECIVEMNYSTAHWQPKDNVTPEQIETLYNRITGEQTQLRSNKDILNNQLNEANELPIDILCDEDKIQWYSFISGINNTEAVKETLQNIQQYEKQVVSIFDTDYSHQLVHLDDNLQLVPYDENIYPNADAALKTVLSNDNIAKLVSYEDMLQASTTQDLTILSESSNNKYPYIKINYSDNPVLVQEGYLPFDKADKLFQDINEDNLDEGPIEKANVSLFLDSQNSYNLDMELGFEVGGITEHLKQLMSGSDISSNKSMQHLQEYLKENGLIAEQQVQSEQDVQLDLFDCVNI